MPLNRGLELDDKQVGIQLGGVSPVGEVSLAFAAQGRVIGCWMLISLGEVLDYFVGGVLLFI